MVCYHGVVRAGLCFVIAMTFVARVAAQDAEPDGELPDELAAQEPAVEPAAEEPEPAAPIDTWTWPGKVLLDLSVRVHFPLATNFDHALIAHAYGHTGVTPSMTFGIAFPVGVEWLWIGGRAGLRGRTWDHAYHSGANLVGVDLMATIRARANFGSVELGCAVSGGVGWAGLWVNGAMTDTFAPRVDVAVELAFQIGRHFAIGPRLGWDYFEFLQINRYGHSVDAGGLYIAIGIEGRE
jgi:hypothetical protein